MNNDYNCKTCLYANDFGEGLVMCDKKLLSENKEIIIEVDKVRLNCPCHSDRFIEETRYMRENKDLREAEDSCRVCGRLMDILNDDNYEDVVEEVITVNKDKNGKEIETVEEHIVRKCKICINKGRNLFEQK